MWGELQPRRERRDLSVNTMSASLSAEEFLSLAFLGFCWMAGLLGVDFLKAGVDLLGMGVVFLDVDFSDWIYFLEA